MRSSLETLERKLGAFHRPHVERCLRQYSPIAGPQFKNDFNLAGFFRALNALPDAPTSFWGIDRCLRMREAVDGYRSRVFHMGMFARGIDLNDDFAEPARDPRFQQLQRETLEQFFAMVDRLDLDPARLQASCFGGTWIGGPPDGRDRRLRQRYRLPADRVSRQVLRHRRIKTLMVPAIAGLFILPEEGSLVGPRLEVFYGDLEFATIVFGCFRIRNGALEPINYVAAYVVGIERLLAATTGADFLHCVPRYVRARQLVERRIKVARSPLFEREVATIVFGIEALAALPDKLTRAQQALMKPMKGELKFYILNLGLPYADVVALFRLFRTALRQRSRRNGATSG